MYKKEALISSQESFHIENDRSRIRLIFLKTQVVGQNNEDFRFNGILEALMLIYFFLWVRI